MSRAAREAGGQHRPLGAARGHGGGGAARMLACVQRWPGARAQPPELRSWPPRACAGVREGRGASERAPSLYEG